MKTDCSFRPFTRAGGALLGTGGVLVCALIFLILSMISGSALASKDAEGLPLVRPMLELAHEQGLDPHEVRALYHLPDSLTAGMGRTIAIVTAFHNANAEEDLLAFSRHYGLPECTSDNGCFTQVRPSGSTITLRSTAAWMIESSLDVQWAHAIAPGARILLVEARSDSWSDLLAAVDYAKFRAQYVSMSWGSVEFPEQGLLDGHFSQPGVSFFASAGDTSETVHFPSSSPRVVSVGGTMLRRDRSSNLAEYAWPRTGWGCSRFERATTSQIEFVRDRTRDCGESRATPDMSLLADPGVNVLWRGNWIVAGGTSAATVIAAAKAAASGLMVNQASVYEGRLEFRAVRDASPRATFDHRTGRGAWIHRSSRPRRHQPKNTRPT